VQDALARYVGVVYPHGQTRHYSYAYVPVEARSLGSHSHLLIRLVRLPLVSSLAHIEVSLCCTLTLVTIVCPSLSTTRK
jgi:hypothetical protein